jgi:hypothetical protein
MMTERRPATTIGELDIHLSHVQEALAEFRNSMATMATKADIDHLSRQLDTFATKDELRAAEERLTAQNVPTVAKKVAQGMMFLAAFIAAGIAVGGAIVAVVRFFDGLPKG